MKENSMQKQPLPDFIKEDEFMLTYPCNKMTIFNTKKPMPVLKGEYHHLNYEFIITNSIVQNFVLDGKLMNIEPDMLLAINSQQMHGTNFLVTDVSFLSIQFEKEFLQDLAYGIYGIREVMFDNKPVPNDNEITKLVNTYIDEYNQKKKGYTFVLDNLSVHIVVALFRKLGIANDIFITRKDEDDYIDKIIQYLKQNYEEDFSLDKISDVSNMSKFNLIRKFKESTGMTPNEYFINIRIMKALEHLNNPENKIIDVSVMCGFENHSHFSRIFKSRTGLTPSEYRKKVLEM